MLDPFNLPGGGVGPYRSPSDITNLYRNLPGSVLSTLNADGSPKAGTFDVPGVAPSDNPPIGPAPLPSPYNAEPGTDVSQLWDVPVQSAVPEQYTEGAPMDQAARAQLLAAILGGKAPVPPMSGFPQPGQGYGGLYTDELAQMAKAADMTAAQQDGPPMPPAGLPMPTGADPDLPPIQGGAPVISGPSEVAAAEMPPPSTGVSRGAPMPAPPMPPLEEAMPPDTVSDAAPPTDLNGDKIITIGKGDSMWKLAEKYYGDGRLWTKIAMANKMSVKNPNKIYSGKTLVIPGSGAGRPMPRLRPAA